MSKVKSAGLLTFSALALVLALQSTDAQARGGARGVGGGGMHGARPAAGGSWTRQTTNTRTENGHTRHDQVTGANGKTATHDAVIVNDRANGTRTRDDTWTGPNGGSGSAHTDAQRSDNGYTSNTTATNAKGETATRSVTVTRDASTGTVTRDADVVGFDGKTRDIDSTRTRTDNGYVQNTTVTNAAGQTATRDVTVVRDHDAGTSTRTASYTTANGGTGSSTSTTTRTENGATRETTGTLPNGKTFERSAERTCDKASKTCTTTVENNGGANPGG